MALPNAEALRRMTPEEVLAQLLAERNAAEAAPAGAGIRNLFRLDPPSLDDHHNYKTFERALYHWTDNTDGSDKQKAAAVVGALRNDHKIKKDLKHHLMTVKDRAGMQELGMKELMEFFKEQLGKVETDELMEAYNSFVSCHIAVGETYGDFTQKFDNLYKALVRIDADTKLSDKILTLQLIRSARLPEATRISILTNVKWTGNNKIYEETRRLINRSCSTVIKQGDKQASVKLVTDQGEKDVVYDHGTYYVDGERYISETQHDVLLAGMKRKEGGVSKGAKKIRGGSRGGGRGKGGRAEEAEEEAEGPRCWKCNKRGHVKKDCPKAGDTWDEEGHLTEAQVLHEDVVGHGENFLAEEVLVDMSKVKRTFTDEAEGAAGLDSCCSRTIMGKRWFETYKKKLPDDMRKKIRGPIKSPVNFTFGDGNSLKSLGTYVLPLSLHGYNAMIGVELVKSDIPLLLSKQTMSRCAMVLDFQKMKTIVFGRAENMKESSVGHPIIRVIPRQREPFVKDEEVLLVDQQEVLISTRYLSKKDLTEEEQRLTIRKVHKQFGHLSSKKFYEFFRKSSINWTPGLLKEELKKIEKTCEGCQLKRRRPDKPAACIPHADGFNQCVGIDLKVESGPGGGIILYVIDMWSKLMQGCYVPSKKPEHIVAGILDCWISKYGIFDRTVHDNGGEFVGKAFVEMTDLLGIQDTTTAAHSPFSAGIVEKHHALCDKTLEALRRDFPKYDKKILLNWALAIKNSTTTSTGWSPYQVIYQRNPRLPSTLESDLPGLREEVTSRELMQNLNAIEQARIKYNEALADTQIKRAISAKTRRNLTVFERGDDIYWKSLANIQHWLTGKVLAVDGKILWVRRGSALCRVSADMAVKKYPQPGETGVSVEARKSIGNDEPEQEDPEKFHHGHADDHPTPRPGRPEKKRVYSFHDNEDEDKEERQQQAAEVRRDLRERAARREESGPPAPAPLDKISPVSSGAQSSGTSVFNKNANTDGNPSHDTPIEQDEDDVFEPAMPSPEDERIEVIPDAAGVRVMMDTEARERRGSKRKTTGSSYQSKKVRKVTERIRVKKGEWLEVGRVDGEKFVCQVDGYGGKAGGKDQNRVNLIPPQGDKFGIDLTDENYSWRKVERPGAEQVLYTAERGEECLLSIIPRHQQGNMECDMAKKAEIDKIVNKFNAVEVVPDNGQFKISSRFVLWHKKHSDGTTEVRARLVARGYEEKEEIPSDSPTIDQCSLKLMLGVAVAFNWGVETVDIKSAFLQGIPLNERNVFVKPPPEAKVPAGHLWKLKISLYGLQDASLRFHWKVREIMKKIGLKQSKYDPAVFIDKNEGGRIRGVIGSHVDDFLLAGGKTWRQEMIKKIGDNFQIGKVEGGNFLYCGYRMETGDDSITLSQQEFADDIKPIAIQPSRKKEGGEAVTEKERSTMRSYAGKLGWLGRNCRPDLLFSQIETSSVITRATVNDLKKLAKAVNKVHDNKSYLKVPKLSSDPKNWTIQLFTDASWKNLGEAGSAAGKVVYISDGSASYPVYWGAHKLRRVCHSAQTAEIMALNEGINDGQLIREMIEEMTGVKVDMEAIIDNRNAYAALTANTAPTDKRLRCEVAEVREAIMLGEVKRIKLVSSKHQLADALTKTGADGTNILISLQCGVRVEELGH